jgi:protease-4
MDKNLQDQVMEKVLLAAIKEQQLGRRWKIFFRLLWLVLIILLVYFSANRVSRVPSGKAVAVINLQGVINSENDTYTNIAEGLQSALKNKNTVAVIIRANSPGGSPVYSDMLYNEILRLRKEYPAKPISVVVEEVCASGCYYIAAAADKIYASPASIVGSIGVIYTGFGLTELMQKIGVDSRLLIAGKNKAMGYPFVAVNKTQTVMQQQMLDKVHTQFINAVKSGRGSRLKLSEPDLFSGRYWVGEEATPLGLIDGYATVDTLAKQKYHTDNIVDFTPQSDSFDRIAKKFGVTITTFAKQMVYDLSSGSFM